MEQLFQRLDDLYHEMVDIRRHLHQNPELSFKEVKTPKFIAEYHRKLNHDVRMGVGGRGVVAKLYGAKPGPTIALRADFDALPIQEQNDVPYKSKIEGVMHACGHDGHTAELLVLAKVLNSLKDELAGTIVFIHQHAEEMQPGGAIAMIEDGCLEGVDVIFGAHLLAPLSYGTIGYHSGPFMSATDRFSITLQGKGGHGGLPHHTKDTVVSASQLVLNLQQIVSRRVAPLEAAVLSIGNFVAHNAFNVIADTAQIDGTVRTFSEDVQLLIKSEMERIIKGTCMAADIDADFKYFHGYPTVVNHETETCFLSDIAKDVIGVRHVLEIPPEMRGEDFAYYLQCVKGTFFYVGAGNGDEATSYPHHHPKFNIEEKAMLIAAKTFGKAVFAYSERYNQSTRLV